MELIRSVSYPAKALYPAAHSPVEEDARVDRRAEEQARIVARKQQSISLESDPRKQNVTQIVIQAPANQSPELTGLPQLPAGQSSSAFLAQQMAQLPEEELESSQTTAHRNATGAYGSTLGLTTTILGLDGFRERIV